MKAAKSNRMIVPDVGLKDGVMNYLFDQAMKKKHGILTATLTIPSGGVKIACSVISSQLQGDADLHDPLNVRTFSILTFGGCCLRQQRRTGRGVAQSG